MATQDPTDSRTPSNVEIQGFMEEEDDIREEDIPQLTSVVAQCRFWWKFSMWPLVFLAANAIVVFSLYVDEYEQKGWILRTPSNYKKHVVVATHAAIWTVVLWLDGIAFYKAAKVVERQIIDMESDSEISSLSSLSHRYVYARVSNMADTFLCSGRSALKVSFFVNLLLLAFTIAMSASLVTVVTALYISLGPGFLGCLTDDAVALPQDINVAAVPVELQEWARGSDGYRVVNYIHLAGGTTFFSGQDTDNGFGGYLAMAMTNGTFKFYPDIETRSRFFAIGGIDERNITNGMCLTYVPYVPYYGLQRFGTDPETRLLCYNSSETMFRNTTIPSPVTTSESSGTEYSIQWFNDTVWLRATFQDYRSGDARTGIYSADYKNMMWTNVVKPDPYRPPNRCLNYLHWLDIGVGTLALIFSSFWLLKFQGIPSGMVPLTAFVISGLSSLSWSLGFFIGLMGAIAAATSLVGHSLPARMNREMVLWTLYTILSCLVFPLDYLSWTLLFPSEYRYFAINHGVTATALLFLVVIGLILNHPVLQMMGCVSVMGTIVLAFSSFVQPQTNRHELFLVIPIGIAMSCGLVSTGYRLTRYRAYMVWYSRRLWGALKDLSPGRQAANTHSQDGNLTQHLVSSRANSP
jgi:hypothetical protein